MTDYGTLRLNTSNQNKLKEFQRMFASFGVTLDHTALDLREILGTPEEVVQNKATEAGDSVIIEDTRQTVILRLDIEDADVGVEIRWIVDHMDQFAGKKALWRVLLGVKKGEHVHIYEGSVEGRIVPPRGDSKFGFDPVFEPLGTTKTLAEDKPDSVSARYTAVRALCTCNGARVLPALPSTSWTGKWQDH